MNKYQISVNSIYITINLNRSLYEITKKQVMLEIFKDITSTKYENVEEWFEYARNIMFTFNMFIKDMERDVYKKLVRDDTDLEVVKMFVDSEDIKRAIATVKAIWKGWIPVSVVLDD